MKMKKYIYNFIHEMLNLYIHVIFLKKQGKRK